MTTTAIFIKTWRDDLPWLRHCVDSIQKYASGFSECVIVADKNCRYSMEFVPPNFGIKYVPQWPNGYIQQQWCKIIANRFTDADQILFVDSDCVFFAPFTPETFMKDDKPILLKTRYSELGNTVPWKPITEAFVGFPVEWEYMRRMPILLLSSTLSGFVNFYPNTEATLRALKTNSFSEFNVLGAVAEKHQPDAYIFQDTADFLPDAVCRQFWSWGKITDEVKKEMESFL